MLNISNLIIDKIIKIPIFLLLTLTIFSQCKSGGGRQTEGEPIVINLYKQYTEKKIYLQDVAKVEYMKIRRHWERCERHTGIQPTPEGKPYKSQRWNKAN